MFTFINVVPFTIQTFHNLYPDTCDVVDDKAIGEGGEFQ